MANPYMNWLSYIRIPLFLSSAAAGAASFLLYFKQNEIIYPRAFPAGSRTDVPSPDQLGLNDFEDIRIRTPDGEALHAYFIPPANRAHAINVTVLMFHGNAGNIGHRLPIAEMLESLVGCNVFMLEYRGYGLSTGTPNENGLRIDAQAGLDYLRQRPEAKNTKIVIFGQSIGGAVATALTAKNLDQGDIAGLILENTFLSIRKLIPSAFPPAKFLAPLCHEYWRTEDVLPGITSIPILFLSGLQDEIVPPSHMKTLFGLCKARTKIWKEFPRGHHNDSVAEELYFETIDEFIQTHIMRPPENGKIVDATEKEKSTM